MNGPLVETELSPTRFCGYHLDSNSSSFCLFQIDLDVNRTYRDHEMFRDRYNTRQKALFHVLAAYSVYNTEVGYCQVRNLLHLFK